MENQIVLTGNEAKKYTLFQRRISEIFPIGVDAPTGAFLEILSHIFTLHAYIRETAMWIGADPNYSGSCEVEKARSSIENALFHLPNGFDASVWGMVLSGAGQTLEAMESYLKKES